jgi:2-desacetyl-2-hydroxyethyl bacteriochlorophyllide A dehydrogenase
MAFWAETANAFTIFVDDENEERCDPQRSFEERVVMRALVYAGPRQMLLRELPRPRLADGECEIAVSVAGICGSDIAAFLGRSRRRTPPMVLGHELVGRRPDGQRVVANPLIGCGRCEQCLTGAQNLCSGLRLLGMDQTAGCHAEFVVLPATQVYAVPGHLTDACAAMAEPLSNIVHLFNVAALRPSFRIGIVGGGLMGSLALQTALSMGVREVLVEDISEVRLENVRAMGATLAVNVSTDQGRAEARRFAGQGLDLVLDACGTEIARQAAFDLCKPRGVVVLLGMATECSEINFSASIYKELRVAMSFGYTPDDFERSLDLLTAGKVDLTPWTAELPLEEGQMAFEQIAGARGATLKMLLRISPA